MFVVINSYKKSVSEIEKYLLEHRSFLDEGYKNNHFVVSGPLNPREGGMVISQLSSRSELESILKKDPFYVHGLIEYKILELVPTKYHPNFSAFINDVDNSV